MADYKIHLISYASGPFLPRERAFYAEADAFGAFDACRVFHFEDLSAKFRAEYADLLSEERGGGLWVWKARIIRDYLENVSAGDVVFYADVGCSVVNTAPARRRFAELVELVREHQMLRFQMHRREYQSTNSAAIKYFVKRFGKDAAELSDSYILAGGLLGFLKSPAAVRWVDEWLAVLADDRHLFTTRYNSENTHPKFIGHQHDQSITSLLSKCYPPAPARVPISSMGWVRRPLSHPFLATRLRRAEPHVVLQRKFRFVQLFWPILTSRQRIKIWRNFFR